MNACGIGIVKQYKACYPCHFTFSSELDMFVLSTLSSASDQHPLQGILKRRPNSDYVDNTNFLISN